MFSRLTGKFSRMSSPSANLSITLEYPTVRRVWSPANWAKNSLWSHERADTCGQNITGEGTWVLWKVPPFRRSLAPLQLGKKSITRIYGNAEKIKVLIYQMLLHNMNCWIKKSHNMGWSLAGKLWLCLVEKTRKIAQKSRWIEVYLFQLSVSSKVIRFYSLRTLYKNGNTYFSTWRGK